MQKKRFLIYGRVQGVGFRYFTWNEAQNIGVLGFVRNLWDGSVEVVACGTEAQIEAFSAWLHHGPRTAKVTQVFVEDYLSEREFTEFQVLH